jgi:class 3 adenylate cyclase
VSSVTRTLSPVRICANCGEENPDRFRLCGFCGTPFEEALPSQETRKTVTIVFSDLKGSTSLGEKLDSEALRAVMTEYFDAMRTVLERHGGRIEKFIGDAVMAVFGLPRLHEDDALRAVRAAADMQAALEALNTDLEARWGVTLQNRTGVNTGEVVAGDSAADQRLITGDAVNVAARLEQAAPAQQVLLGELTYRLVADMVSVEEVEPLELKGKSERVAAYRLVAVLQDAGVRAGGGRLTPMVGRDEEHAELLAQFDGAVADRRPRLVTVLGEAGVGKSRLTAEFLASVEASARVMSGRCLSYGDGITFWPMADAIRIAADID